MRVNERATRRARLLHKRGIRQLNELLGLTQAAIDNGSLDKAAFDPTNAKQAKDRARRRKAGRAKRRALARSRA